MSEGHGSVALYVWVGVILAIVTGVEVAVFYIEALADVKVPIMVILSAAKVVLVVMFFMHLKMDRQVLTWIFVCGAGLALLMISALTILYHLLPRLEGTRLFVDERTPSSAESGPARNVCRSAGASSRPYQR
jgi:heme/copper-type cytochrome/quinol oxidase subunit 4